MSDQLLDAIGAHLASFSVGRVALLIVLAFTFFAVPRGTRRWIALAFVLVSVLDAEWAFLFGLGSIGIVLTLKSFRRVPEGGAQIVERLGRYLRTLSPGAYLLAPWVDSVRTEVGLYTYGHGGERRIPLVDGRGNISTQEQILDFGAVEASSIDGAFVSIDVLTSFKIAAPEQAVYGVGNLARAMIEQIETTVRRRVASLRSRDLTGNMGGLENQVRHELQQSAESWGVEIVRVGVPEIRIVGGDQPAPALYFCDCCQESVPVNDIVTKKITIEGRLLCRRCGSRTSAGS